MTAGAILRALVEAGVAVWLDGGALRYRAPAGALTDELRAAVAASRVGLVALLRAGAGLPAVVAEWPEDARDSVEERAAIQEYDGGLPREVAEREAEGRVRLGHARAFLDRHALDVDPEAHAVAGRPRGGPHR